MKPFEHIADDAPPGTPGTDLLEPIGAPVAVAAVDRFVASDRFVADRGGELPIRYIGDDFTRHFLPLVEADLRDVLLQRYILLQGSVDEPIFAALGGRERARISLAHLYEFLKGADRSRWYFVYVADAEGDLWAIDTYWRDGGWDLEAYSVTYPRGWRGGGCVVSGLA